MNTLKSAPDSAFQELLHSPRLPKVVEKLQIILDEERSKRERFYEDLQEDQTTEFINGEIILHTPVKRRHSQVSDLLFVLLHTFVQRKGIGEVRHEKILISLTRNDYEPDICFFGPVKSKAFTDTQLRFPAPDFVVEVLSEAFEANDRGVKLEDYAAHGIAEYWIIDPREEFVEQYILGGEVYELLIKAKTGVIASRTIEGFEIPVRAIFDSQIQMATLGIILKDTD